MAGNLIALIVCWKRIAHFPMTNYKVAKVFVCEIIRFKLK